jgi:hypothetical protein
MHAGIYKNTDTPDARLDALVKCLARVFEPGQATRRAIAPPPPAPNLSLRKPSESKGTSAQASKNDAAESKRYRDKAAETRQLATSADTSCRRERLLNVALNYEQTAQHLEVLSRSQTLEPRSGRR